MKKCNCACENGENNIDQKLYASMARMFSNDKQTGKKYSDSLQLTDLILDSGATCHMTPEVSDFTPGSLKDTDK